MSVCLYNHSLDFLLSCKDPGSTQRAILHRLESQRPKLELADDSDRSSASPTDDLIRDEAAPETPNDSSGHELNLKPFSLRSVEANGDGRGPDGDTSALTVVHQMAISSRSRNLTHSRLRRVRALNRPKQAHLNKKTIRMKQQNGGRSTRSTSRVVGKGARRAGVSKFQFAKSRRTRSNGSKSSPSQSSFVASKVSMNVCGAVGTEASSGLTVGSEKHTPSVVTPTGDAAPASLPSGLTRYVKVSLIRVSVPGEQADGRAGILHNQSKSRRCKSFTRAQEKRGVREMYFTQSADRFLKVTCDLESSSNSDGHPAGRTEQDGSSRLEEEGDLETKTESKLAVSVNVESLTECCSGVNTSEVESEKEQDDCAEQEEVKQKTQLTFQFGSKTVVIKDAKVVLSDIVKNGHISTQTGSRYHTMLRKRNNNSQTKETENIKTSAPLSSFKGRKSSSTSERVKKNSAENSTAQRAPEGTTLPPEPISPLKCSMDHNSQSSIPLKKRVFRESLDADPDQDASVTTTTTDPAHCLSKTTDTEADSMELASESSASVRTENEQSGSAVEPNPSLITKLKVCRKTLIRKRFRPHQTKPALVHTRVLRDRSGTVTASPAKTNGPDQAKIHKSKMTNVEKCVEVGKETGEKNDIRSEGTEMSQEIPPSVLPAPENGNNDANHPCTSEDEQNLNFRIRLKRKRGKEWEMEGGRKADGTLPETQSLNGIDPFRAILDSVAILNLEMERIRGHREVDKSLGLEQATKAVQDVLEHCQKESTFKSRRKRRKISAANIDGGKRLSEPTPVPGPQDDLAPSRRLDQLARNLKVEVESFDMKPLPLLKLRRKDKISWEVDGKDVLKQEHRVKELESFTIRESRLPLDRMPLRVKQESLSPCHRWIAAGKFDRARECDKDTISSEPSLLSLSPLSLNSPNNDATADVSFIGELRGKETSPAKKMLRVENPESIDGSNIGLCHNLLQINKSLSKLQAMSQQAPLERGTSATTSCQIQSKPLSPSSSPFNTECVFPNYPEDILDFPCLNLDGYDHVPSQSTLTNTLADYCPAEPDNNGSFSSPFSQSPADGWNPETSYLGSASPGSSFGTSEDLSFSDLGLPRDDGESYFTSKEKTFCSAASSTVVKEPERNKLLLEGASRKRPVILQTREDSSLFLTDKPSSQRDSILFNTALNAKTLPSCSLPQDKMNFFEGPRSLSAQLDFARVQAKDKSSGPFHFSSTNYKSQPSFLNQSVPGLYNSVLQGNPVKPFHSVHTGSKATPSLESPLNLGGTVFHGFDKKQTIFPNPNSLMKMEGGGYACKGSSLGDKIKSHGTKSGPNKSVPGPSSSQGDMDPSSSCPSNMYSRSMKTVTLNKGLGQVQQQPDKVYPVYFNSGKAQTNTSKNVPVDKLRSSRVDNPDVLSTFFPSTSSQTHSILQNKSLRQDKPQAVVAPNQSSQTSLPLDRSQLFLSHCDSLDAGFGSRLSPAVSQHSSPQVSYQDGVSQNVPASKAQPSGLPYGQSSHPSYVVNFTGDHSLTLNYNDGAECLNYSSSMPTNYTYHCLMEPSGTQGRLIVEQCGPSGVSHASSVGGFTETSKQHGQPRCHPVNSHHFQSSQSQNGSLSDRKPKRLRLVVTDGTVDLDLQYTD